MKEANLRVAFRLNGGIGTYVTEVNFIQYVYDAFPGLLDITVYGDNSETVNNGLLRGQYFISSYFPRSLFHTDYDLTVDINWFPKILKANWEKLKKTSQKFHDLAILWKNLGESSNTKHFVEEGSLFEPNIYCYAIARGKTRLTVPDLEEKLRVERSYRLSIPVFADEEKTLNRFGLKSKQYITMQSGVDIRSNSKYPPKQWLHSYYNELCTLLKQKHPELTLVQLGEEKNNSPIPSADVCLLGKTSFEELKTVLKNALLHVDGDCGMVHLRKALHGGTSAVFYGQMPVEVHGYDDDIHFTSTVCPHWCGKLFDAWKRRCFRAPEPLCMKAITPDHVADVIDAWLSGRYLFPQPEPTELQKLLNNPHIKLDEEWVQNWLGTRTIYAWWLEPITLQELSFRKLTPEGYIKVPLTECPAWQYLEGNKQSYIDYMALNAKFNPHDPTPHSLQRFEALLQSFEQREHEEGNSMDTEYYITVDGDNTILDGVHRASYLAHKYGMDAQITVLRLYGDWQI